jgi:hypothetical protein
VTARRALAALSFVAFAAPAVAFVRSTTDQGGDPAAGNACLWWAQSALTYQMNPGAYASAPGCADIAAAASLARNSFPAWAQSCTDFQFVDGGTTTKTALGNDGVNLVVFRKGACSDTSIVSSSDPCHATAGACAGKYNCWEHDTAGTNANTIALTTVTYKVADGEIVDADMELFGWDGAATSNLGWYFTCVDNGVACVDLTAVFQQKPSGCISMDIGSTVTHEAGHMLGLSHVCQFDRAHGGTSSIPVSTCAAGSVMNPFAHLGITQRNLDQDDVNAVCAMYPAGKAADKTAGCFAQGAPQGSSTGSGSSSGGGCATGRPGDLALVGLLFLVIRRRQAHERCASRAPEWRRKP